MNRTIRTAIFFGFVAFATPLVASTLSVVPLGEALENPALVDTNSDEFKQHADEVQALMLNKPATEAEVATFSKRVSNLARYRDTRVGKLFFGALKATPAIENLGEGAEFAELTSAWPLSFGSRIRVRVAFTKKDDVWLISALEVTADGVAAAPISGMAPYFGNDDINADLLDIGPIDYLVGRDPADREKIETDRAPFDFDAAIKDIFETDEGAFETVINKLVKEVTPSTDVEDRIKTMREYLATDEEKQALVDASSDPERSLDFWKGIFAQLKQVAGAPRPNAVPKTSGAEVTLRFRLVKNVEVIEGVTSAIRLENGKVAPRGGGAYEEQNNGE